MANPRRNRASMIVLSLALLATACSDDEPAGGDAQAGAASGEVLEGTISDEMLPVDRLRSQPPRLADNAAGAEDTEEGDPAAQTDVAQPEQPAATPTTEAAQMQDGAEAFDEEGASDEE